MRALLRLNKIPIPSPSLPLLTLPTVLLLLLVLHTPSPTNAVPALEHFGFQSGYQFKESSGGAVDGYSYGSSLHYDSSNDLLYITGSTYWSYWDNAGQILSDASKAKYMQQSDCFVGVLKLPNESQRREAHTNKHIPQIMFADRFGVEGVNEACSAVTLMNGQSGDGNNMANMVIAGHTEEEGFLTSLRQLGSTKSAMYGFLLNMDLRLEKETKRTVEQVSTVQRSTDSGMILNDEMTQYPVAVTSNPNDTTSNEVYVLSLASTTKDENDYDRVWKPDLTAAGGVEEPPYGKHFHIILHKVLRKTSDEIDYELKEAQYYNDGNVEEEEAGVPDALKSGWTQIYSLTNPKFSSPNRRMVDAQGPSSKNAGTTYSTFVRVADIKYIPYTTDIGQDDHLILAGSTNGYGEAFGRTQGGLNVHIAHHGFVTKLSTEGDIIESKSIHIDGKFVSIKGICYDKTTKGEVELFVVGETNGKLDESMTTYDVSTDSSGRFGRHAFITKLDFTTLDVLWSRQIGGFGGSDVVGYGCAASASDGIVYMTGTVKSGGKLRVLQKDINDSNGRVDVESAGGDDIFVANFDIDNGTTNFVRQLGTSQHDSIAKGDGIVIDGNGDAIIMGNTKGSMMRWRGEGVLAADGDPYDVFIMSIAKEDGKSRVISEISKTNPDSNGDDDDGDDVIIPGSGDGQDRRGELEGFEIFAMTLAAVILLVTMMYVGFATVGGDSHSAGIANSDRIIDYVRDFHDDDVRLHVRHSATGGIHGIYSPVKSRQSEMLDTGVHGEEEEKTAMAKTSSKRVSFGDDNTTNALVASQDSFQLQSLDSHLLSPSRRPRENPRSLTDLSESVEAALESVEADFRTKTQANMTQSTTPSTYMMNSTPVFDGGLVKMSQSEQQTSVQGIQASPTVPPNHAFRHKSDEEEDDEWETELL